MLWSVILVTVLCAVFAVRGECPPDEYLIPWGCRCRAASRVQCTNVADAKKFEMIMTACRGHDLLEFTLVNAKLDFLPASTFESINTLEFVLSKSVLQSLSAGSRIFKGSGIQNFIIDNTDIHDGDLTQIGDLNELKQLVIRDYRNYMVLSRLINWIQHTEIKELILENLSQVVWQGSEVSQLYHLRSLSLSGLELKEISKRDLPEYVGQIENLWLKNNYLVDLPDDFLEGMTNLKVLDLSANRFQTLREETFASFEGFIVLHDNPLICDWRLDWLRARLRSNSLKIMTPQPITCEDGSRLLD